MRNIFCENFLHEDLKLLCSWTISFLNQIVPMSVLCLAPMGVGFEIPIILRSLFVIWYKILCFLCCFSFALSLCMNSSAFSHICVSDYMILLSQFLVVTELRWSVLTCGMRTLALCAVNNY